MQVIDCDNNAIINVKIEGKEYPLREFTFGDEEFLSSLKDDKEQLKGLKEALKRCGLPLEVQDKIPLSKIKIIAEALKGVYEQEKK